MMTDLRAGYADRCITPPMGAEMTGYGPYLDRRVEGVLDDLKVRALVLRQADDGLVLVSCDLLGLTIDFPDGLRRTLAVEHDVAPKRVIIACTHTHTGPASLPMRSMGEVDPAWMETLAAAVQDAAAAAEADVRSASCRRRATAPPPIGFNRRNRTFHPIDSLLRVLVFEAGDRPILLLNYACHPVTLRRVTQVSADWPGALAAELEREGYRAIVFQGFAGDINPVDWLNGWQGGMEDAVALYGRTLADRALRATKEAAPMPDTALRVAERRIALPLAVPTAEELEQRTEELRAQYGKQPDGDRFVDDWSADARARLETFQREPWIGNVPVHAAAIGDVPMLSLPGEVLCEYALALRKPKQVMLTFGCSQGNAGYFPTAAALAVAGDYEAHGSPAYYGVFPFAPAIEATLLDAARQVLDEVRGESA